MKKILLAIIIIIGIIYGYNIYTKDDMYVMIPSHGIKEKVPEDIVKMALSHLELKVKFFSNYTLLYPLSS